MQPGEDPTLYDDEGGGFARITNGDYESGSPSKTHRKHLSNNKKKSSKRGNYAICVACCILSLVTGAAVAIFLVYGLKSITGNDQNNNDSGQTTTDALQAFLSTYDYSSCPSQWALESSGYDGPLEREVPCNAFIDSDTCASTINCCWVDEFKLCVTHEAKPECTAHISRHTCAEDPYCAWVPPYGCRRGFQRTTMAQCAQHWVPSELIPERECNSFLSEDACANQLGCCWNGEACSTYDNMPECASIRSQDACNQRQFCTWSGSVCQRGERTSPLTPSGNKKTNVVLIVADDLGYGDVGFTGGIARTPNLDVFTRSPYTLVLGNMHSTPVCSPSRASILGGQYPDVNCVSGARIDTTFNLHPDMTTIADDARAAGYATAMFGKWHLGRLDNNAIGLRGFENWTASYGNIITYDTPCFCNEVLCKQMAKQCPASEGCKSLSGGVCTATATNQCFLGHNDRTNFIRNPPNSFDCDLSRLGPDGKTPVPAGLPRHMMYSHYVASEFRAFVQSLPDDRPFLTYIAFSEPHIVYIADPVLGEESEKYHKLPVNSRAANYIAVVEAIDIAVGSIRDTLAEIGRLEDSLILFTSDNGPEKYEQGGSGSARPYRGWKRTLLEGGVHVPSFIFCPGLIKRNQRTSSFTGLIDIRPTLRELYLSQNPSIQFTSVDFDGESFFPLLNGATWTRSKSHLICMPMTSTNNKKCETFAYYEDDWKLILHRGNELGPAVSEFYNLKDDPYESKNLVNKNRGKFNELATRARQAVQSLMSRHNSRCAGAYTKA